jgi:preprotein translocase YajC subunit
MDDSLFLLLALAFLGAMLFYSSRKRRKAAENLRASLAKGSYVMLTSGIFGKITEVMDTRIELEIASGAKMIVAIGAVRSIEEELKISKPASKTAAKSSSKDSKSPSKASKSPSKPTTKKK